MFNRYWRTYPWFLQFFLFITMIYTLMWFGVYLSSKLVPAITGVPATEMVALAPGTAAQVTRASLLFQGTVHAFMYAIPALLFANFTHPRVGEYLGFRRPGKAVHWLLVTGIMLGLLPVSIFLETWLQTHLHFGAWADKLQEQNENTVKAFLGLSAGPDFIWLFVVLAILPAFGEELIFRGILMRFLHKAVHRTRNAVRMTGQPAPIRTQRNMLSPVITSSLMFALVHINPYGFLPIFLAGVILAAIYWLTGSIWCSIWAHLLFNGSQVAGTFFSAGVVASAKPSQPEQLPVSLLLGGLLVLGATLYGLVRMRTPLPPDWSDDFRPDELPAD